MRYNPIMPKEKAMDTTIARITLSTSCLSCLGIRVGGLVKELGAALIEVRVVDGGVAQVRIVEADETNSRVTLSSPLLIIISSIFPASIVYGFSSKLLWGPKRQLMWKAGLFPKVSIRSRFSPFL
jgi:hypothetical protein